MKPKNRRTDTTFILLFIAVIFFVGVLALTARFEMRGKRYAFRKKSLEEDEEGFEMMFEEEVTDDSLQVEPVYIHEQVPLYIEPSGIPQPTEISVFNLKSLPDLHPHIPPSTNLPVINPICLTPLAALKSGLISRVSDLIAAEIHLDEIDPENGYTILHYLAMSYDFMALEMALKKKLYLKRGGVNARAHNGDTPLHLAVKHHIQPLGTILAFYLMKYGANPKLKNKANQVPIVMARKLGLDMMAVLEKRFVFPPEFQPVDHLRDIFNGPVPADPYYCYGMEPKPKDK